MFCGDSIYLLMIKHIWDFAQMEENISDSTLLCTEMDISCFDDVENMGEVTDSSNQDAEIGDSILDSLASLQCPSDEQFKSMVDKEKDYLPRDDYLQRLKTGMLDLSVRREAIDWILKAYIRLGFGVLVLSLSMNYLDRFLSLYELPGDKAWAVQLLAVACLSLAAKMEEINVPLTVNLQVGKPKFIFEGKTIRRMELLVLSTLKWKMRAFTPHSFIDYFLSKVTDDRLLLEAMITNCIQLILSTIRAIDFLEFKPSEIGAAVAILTGLEKQALEDIDKTLSSFIQIEKDKVMKCIGLIQDLITINNVTRYLPHSPDRVLDAACLSYKSDKTTVESCPNSTHNGPETKRRKLQDTNTYSSQKGHEM